MAFPRLANRIMSERIIRWLLAFFARAPEAQPRPWLIDREGVCYLPERRVVLKAKSTP